MHHIISDAWSMGVLVREVARLYESFSTGRLSPVPEPPIQYADFACWQREWLKGETLESQLSYWRQRLQDAPAVLFSPTEGSRSAASSSEGATYEFALPVSLTEKLKSLSRRQGVTLFITLLAAFKTLLHRYSQQEDIVVGADIANRNRAETENLIGFFVNMLVLRTDLSGDPRFLELLGRVREVALGAYAHQDVPLEKLVEELQPERDLSHSPLFQVVFNFNNSPAPRLSMPGLDLSLMRLSDRVVKFDLSLFMNDADATLRGAWRFNTALFSPSRVERMHGHFETLLQSIIEHPESRLGDLEIYSRGEKEERRMKEQKLKKANFNNFMKITPKAINRSPEGMIKTGRLADGSNLPLVVEPQVKDLDPVAWARQNVSFIESNLLEHGAILFRNFSLSSIEEFYQFASVVSPGLLDYSEPSSPRTEVRDKVYTSTEYPSDQSIEMHNEMSYSHNWPRKVFFFCATPAEQGGETPIADSRKVFQLIDPKIRDRFIEKKVMYVRNFGDGLSIPWQTVFNTSDKSEVEEHCRNANIDFEWKGNDRLRTRQVRQAIANHPKRGETVWFNQAHALHQSVLGPEVLKALLAEMKEEDLPRNVFYGDGTPIEAAVLDEIRSVYKQASVYYPWRQSDVLVLDNMLVAHGRAPFAGPRKVYVAMSELFSC
jgi:alpha-ketoglutarate-dependent taurine dioxygenase